MPWQGEGDPDIAFGCEGNVTGVTAKVRDSPLPQTLDGVTAILPEAAPTTTDTAFELPPDVCDHPEGNVHV